MEVIRGCAGRRRRARGALVHKCLKDFFGAYLRPHVLLGGRLHLHYGDILYAYDVSR